MAVGCKSPTAYFSEVIVIAKYKDLTGQQFGWVTVIERVFEKRRDGHASWLCRCKCGKEYIASSHDLLQGKSTSCGCKRAMSNTKHGDGRHSDRSRLYHVWADMKNRCSSPKCHAYKHYGARGIKVCDEWMEYEPFRDWSYSNGYAENLTLDRIDVNGDYEPSNCRWATRKEQANNKRGTIKLSYNNITRPLSEWAEKLGVKSSLLYSRLKKGWEIDAILLTPTVEQIEKLMQEIDANDRITINQEKVINYLRHKIT